MNTPIFAKTLAAVLSLGVANALLGSAAYAQSALPLTTSFEELKQVFERATPLHHADMPAGIFTGMCKSVDDATKRPVAASTVLASVRDPRGTRFFDTMTWGEPYGSGRYYEDFPGFTYDKVFAHARKVRSECASRLTAAIDQGLRAVPDAFPYSPDMQFNELETHYYSFEDSTCGNGFSSGIIAHSQLNDGLAITYAESPAGDRRGAHYTRHEYRQVAPGVLIMSFKTRYVRFHHTKASELDAPYAEVPHGEICFWYSDEALAALKN